MTFEILKNFNMSWGLDKTKKPLLILVGLIVTW